MSLKWKTRMLPILALLLSGWAANARDFAVADFGATGDGKTNDGPAIRMAFEAASAAGAGSRVVFDNRSYRLDWNKAGESQISLRDAKDIAVEGNGAMLVNHPRNNLFSLENCEGVSVRGFSIDYDPLPFTQGIITEVNAAEGWMEVRIQKGYSHPVDVYTQLGTSPPKRDWGVVFDPVGRHRRWDVAMHFNMKEFLRSPSGTDIVRVVFAVDSHKELAEVRPGDRYVITYKFGNSGANNELVRCGGCRFEDINLYTAKYGMSFRMENSISGNVFRRVRITFKPGTDRLISTPKDGIHCKGNRVGPLIEECLFEGLLDDSINISACPVWIKKVIAPGVYAMNGAQPLVGDRLTAFTPSRKDLVEGFVVKWVKPSAENPKWHEIGLDREIPHPGVNQTKDDFPGGLEKLGFTGMYNTDACGANYVVRNCTFRGQRRHAILVRAPGGIIEGNTIDGVGGSGVHMANETGSFYEGPVPHNCIIRNNVFRNTQMTPVVVGARSVSSPAAFAKDISITGNTIEALEAPFIKAFCVKGLKVTDNKLMSRTSASAAANPLSLSNSVDETITGNSMP